MAIATDLQRKALATAYGTAAPYGALFTADPGTTGTVVGEVTGGSPAYARIASTWGAAATVSTTATITSTGQAFNVPAGTTVTYYGQCVSGTAGTADLRDRVAITSQTFASQGTYTITAVYTQS